MRARRFDLSKIKAKAASLRCTRAYKPAVPNRPRVVQNRCMSKTAQETWLRRRVRLVRSRPHYSTAAAIFLVLVATMIGAGSGLSFGMLVAFDVASTIFLVTITVMFARSTPATMRTRACQQDGGRWGVLWSSVIVSSIVLVALWNELHAASTGGVIEIALAFASLVLSWIFLNAIFGLHYAHEFYTPSAQKNAVLQFPGNAEPDYWDFMYFAFVLGMTFQVSDVQIADRHVRRIALVHGVIAFFYNLVILALSVNVVAGKI